MLELHLGENISLHRRQLVNPTLLLGNTGQGRSTTLEDIVLQLVNDRQMGALYDPYGDLTRALQSLIVSEEARSHLVVCNDQIAQTELAKMVNEKFVFIYSNKLKVGGRAVRAKGLQVLKTLYSTLQPGSFLIVDEAFEFIDDEIFLNYLNVELGIFTILSDSTLINLSETEQKKLFAQVKNYLIYKIRNIDAKSLADYFPEFDPKSIAAIQQYHYQFFSEGILRYSASKWPLESI